MIKKIVASLVKKYFYAKVVKYGTKILMKQITKKYKVPFFK